MLIGALAALLRQVPARVLAFLRRRLVFTTEVSFTDPAFVWLKFWLNRQDFFRRRRAYVLDTRSGGTDEDGRENLLFVPAEGTYFLRHRGRFLILDFEREELKNAVATGYGVRIVAHRETIRLSCVGRQKGARAYIESILREAHGLSEAEERGKISVHRPSVDFGEWVFSALKSPRPAESLVMKAGLLEGLVDDIREFHDSAAWYREMGIPWRRGYLLHGPPGNGKSSLVTTLAGIFEADVYVLDLTNPRVTDSALNDLIDSVPPRAILVIEDIDAAFSKREKADGGGVSFSGLLNALDGVGSGEGRLLFMTTNHREHLDPALVRPGRADRHFAIENPMAEQIERLFLRFFPGKERVAHEFSVLAIRRAPSMAALQEHLLAYRSSPEGALANLLPAPRAEADRDDPEAVAAGPSSGPASGRLAHAGRVRPR